MVKAVCLVDVHQWYNHKEAKGSNLADGKKEIFFISLYIGIVMMSFSVMAHTEMVWIGSDEDVKLLKRVKQCGLLMQM